MSAFFATQEEDPIKNEIKCVYSKDLIHSFLEQSTISNAATVTMEQYSFHETTYDETPQDIYYHYISDDSKPFKRKDCKTKEDWFENSFAKPTQRMIKMIFDIDKKSTFQFDSTNNYYYANDIDVSRSGETVKCNLKVAFINNQLMYTDVISNDGTIKEHVNAFAKNSFIEVPEFPEPELN